MWPNPKETADLVTFTEEILNGKLRFLCSDYSYEILKRYENCHINLIVSCSSQASSARNWLLMWKVFVNSLKSRVTDLCKQKVKMKVPDHVFFCGLSTTMFIIFWKILIDEQIFFLPQLKRSEIISNKNGL